LLLPGAAVAVTGSTALVNKKAQPAEVEEVDAQPPKVAATANTHTEANFMSFSY
jgi:hypothetical protein